MSDCAKNIEQAQDWFLSHSSYAPPAIRLKVGKTSHMFEMHSYCGPMRLYASGEPNNNYWSLKSAFWPVFYEWLAQGKRVDKNGVGLVD